MHLVLPILGMFFCHIKVKEIGIVTQIVSGLPSTVGGLVNFSDFKTLAASLSSKK